MGPQAVEDVVAESANHRKFSVPCCHAGDTNDLRVSRLWDQVVSCGHAPTSADKARDAGTGLDGHVERHEVVGGALDELDVPTCLGVERTFEYSRKELWPECPGWACASGDMNLQAQILCGRAEPFLANRLCFVDDRVRASREQMQ